MLGNVRAWAPIAQRGFVSNLLVADSPQTPCLLRIRKYVLTAEAAASTTNILINLPYPYAQQAARQLLGLESSRE